MACWTPLIAAYHACSAPTDAAKAACSARIRNSNDNATIEASTTTTSTTMRINAPPGCRLFDRCWKRVFKTKLPRPAHGPPRYRDGHCSAGRSRGEISQTLHLRLTLPWASHLSQRSLRCPQVNPARSTTPPNLSPANNEIEDAEFCRSMASVAPPCLLWLHPHSRPHWYPRLPQIRWRLCPT